MGRRRGGEWDGRAFPGEQGELFQLQQPLGRGKRSSWQFHGSTQSGNQVLDYGVMWVRRTDAISRLNMKVCTSLKMSALP